MNLEWSISRGIKVFESLNQRLVRKFQKQGQRDVIPNFPICDENTNIEELQNELSKYLISLGASPLVLTAYFFQHFVEDGRNSLIDKRLPALYK